MLDQDTQTMLREVGGSVSASQFESDVLDFKQVARSPKETFNILAEAAVCFTNASGGKLVLGVDDKAMTRADALPGVDDTYTVDGIRKAIFDRTRPEMTVPVYEHFEEGVRLLVIDVPEGIAPHSTAGGTATRRMGRECLPFTPEQQREVQRARGQLDWSAEDSGGSLRDLSGAEVDRMRRLLVGADREELAKLGDEELLQALRVVDGDGAVTNAALLLVGTEAALTERIPEYGYAYQYRPSPGSEATSRFRGNQPIVGAIEILLTTVETRAEVRPLNTAGGVQIALTDYPRRAVREVVVNALIHRAFDSPGTVDVEHSPERLGVSSPGGLVAGVTPENILTHPSTPRHRLLAESVAMLQLAERTGQGIDRAYREMLQAGKEPPRISDSGLAVSADLVGGIGNDSFVRFIGEIPDQFSRDVDVLIGLSVLRFSRTIDALGLAEQIQRSPAQAEEVLRRMADGDSALIEPTRRTLRKPFPTYRLRNEPLVALARAVTYRRRRTLDQTDAKVVEHVQEYGFITNKTVQRLFDRDVYGARNMLTDLRERQILEKLGSARGGPGVRYGRGAKFPRAKALTTDPTAAPDDPSVADQLPLHGEDP